MTKKGTPPVEPKNQVSATPHTINASEKPILTKKQSDVLRLLQKGYRPKQIQTSLLITERTYYFHRANILEKFNGKTLCQAIHLASRSEVSHPEEK
jgi:DNA-binding CsgD family transcriptional regulator